jgi:hypothetical protein
MGTTKYQTIQQPFALFLHSSRVKNYGQKDMGNWGTWEKH